MSYAIGRSAAAGGTQNSVVSHPARPIGRLLRLNEVRHRVGLGKTTIYALMRAGRFPQQVHLTQRAVAWPEDAIEAFIASRHFAGGRPDRTR